MKSEKQLIYMTLEEFRVRHNFTVRDVAEMIGITYDSYDRVKGKPVTRYAMYGEIGDLLREEQSNSTMLDDVWLMCNYYGIDLCNKKKEIVLKALECNNEKVLEKIGDLLQGNSNGGLAKKVDKFTSRWNMITEDAFDLDRKSFNTLGDIAESYIYERKKMGTLI